MTKNKDTKKQSISRSPIVVVLGHVDHGKTTLLDYLRSTHTAEKEAGGITQSIGAYEINKDGKKITFIDTPGHEAFTKMRQRGANIADIAIMIVSADDGVKPQTKEIIEILKESNTPYLVVINKVDKNNANIEKTKQDLIAHNVMLEGFGGDIPYSLISAKTGEGIDDMLDMIILLSEMQGLEWTPSTQAEGFILESHMDKQRGVIASVIIKNGILYKGDNIYTSSSCGNIKILENFVGKAVEKIEPSSPARIVGFDSMLHIGETFSSEKFNGTNTKNDVCKEDKCIESDTENKEVVNVILQSDTSGSNEVLIGSIKNLEFSNFYIKIIASKVGNITDGTIKDASANKALIIGFNVSVDKNAQNIAKSYNIRIIKSDIIYKVTEKIKEEIKHLDQEIEGGKLKVLATFNKQGEKQVIGGEIIKGILQEGDRFNIVRDGESVGSGKIINIQANKTNVKKIDEGECGLQIKTGNEIEKDDIIDIIVQ